MAQNKSRFRVNDAMILYHNPYNFYSQKVLMALYENKCHFIIYNMDILNLENLTKWYLDLKTDGKIPALVVNNNLDGIIVGAANILAELFHFEKRSEKERNLLEILEKIPIGHLTVEALLHGPQMNLVPKPPYILAVRKIILEHEEKMHDRVIKIAHRVEEKYKAKMLQTAKLQENRSKVISNETNFLHLLDIIDHTMGKLEEHLRNVDLMHTWMFENKLHLIDITLGIMLYKLDALGLGNRLWIYGKNENLYKFYQKFIKTPSFLSSTTKNFLHLVQQTDWKKITI